ncbi:MAG: hypothetical protein ACREQ5_14360, partial [Candidatus Dormibacteria bacterium]
AQESDFGLFRHQIHGPAVGIFQMEPEDYNDIWTNYLAYHSYWANQIRALSTTNTVDDMKTNDPYAIAMARIHYMRKPGALPAPTDLNGLWNYYKINYNSRSGAATQTEFYANYKRWVVDGIAV